MATSRTYAQLPPYRWLRLFFLLWTLGLSCVCVAVGAQALNGSNMLEKSLAVQAQSVGLAIMFDMNDIKATTAVLTLVACLLVASSFTFSLTLLIDWVKFLTRPRPKANDQEWSGEEVLESARRLPLSTRTLGIQTAVMSCLTVWLIAVLVPSTLFARTRSAHLTIRGNTSTDLPFGIDTRYWDYGFLRCLAAAPWFSVIVSVPASIATWAAWKSPNTAGKA